MGFLISRLIVLILLVLLVVWLVDRISYTRRRQVFLSTRDTRGRPMLPPHQRVTEDDLKVRASQLRRAIERGHITRDEAIGSLVRLGGSAVSPERAGRLLDDSQPFT